MGGEACKWDSDRKPGAAMNIHSYKLTKWKQTSDGLPKFPLWVKQSDQNCISFVVFVVAVWCCSLDVSTYSVVAWENTFIQRIQTIRPYLLYILLLLCSGTKSATLSTTCTYSAEFCSSHMNRWTQQRSRHTRVCVCVACFMHRFNIKCFAKLHTALCRSNSNKWQRSTGEHRKKKHWERERDLNSMCQAWRYTAQ